MRLLDRLPLDTRLEKNSKHLNVYWKNKILLHTKLKNSMTMDEDPYHSKLKILTFL